MHEADVLKIEFLNNLKSKNSAEELHHAVCLHAMCVQIQFMHICVDNKSLPCHLHIHNSDSKN